MVDRQAVQPPSPTLPVLAPHGPSAAASRASSSVRSGVFSAAEAVRQPLRLDGLAASSVETSTTPDFDLSFVAPDDTASVTAAVRASLYAYSHLRELAEKQHVDCLATADADTLD